MDCTNVNILVVILCSSFTKCYHWGELGKGHTGSLCAASYLNLQLSQNEKLNLKTKRMEKTEATSTGHVQQFQLSCLKYRGKKVGRRKQEQEAGRKGTVPPPGTPHPSLQVC